MIASIMFFYRPNSQSILIDIMVIIQHNPYIGCKLIPETTFKRGYNE